MKLSPRELAAHHGRLIDKIKTATPENKAEYKNLHAQGKHQNHPIHRWQVEAHAAGRQLALLPVTRERGVVWRFEIGGPLDPITARRIEHLTDRVAKGEASDDDRAAVIDLQGGLVAGNHASEGAARWAGALALPLPPSVRFIESGVGDSGWFLEYEGLADDVAGLVRSAAGAFPVELDEGSMRLSSWPVGVAVLEPEAYPLLWPWQEPTA